MLSVATDGCRHLSSLRWDYEPYFEPNKERAGAGASKGGRSSRSSAVERGAGSWSTNFAACGLASTLYAF